MSKCINDMIMSQKFVATNRINQAKAQTIFCFWTVKCNAEAPEAAEFLQKRLISEFFGFQWQNLAEILSLFFWPFWVIFGPFQVIWGHLGSLFGPLRSFWVLTLHLVTAGGCLFPFFVANVAFTRFFCRKSRDYVLFRQNFVRNFGRNSQKYSEFWQKF